MPYMGDHSFMICTHCTRMYNGLKCCPCCGNPKIRTFKETTSVERSRWAAGKHFGDPTRSTKKEEK